tara:strand:+ start:9071 stop:9688 length:618 start_codon:yes stop_codon:yes gene_type:complete
MKVKYLRILPLPLIFLLSYLIIDSINSEITFQKEAKIRIDQNVQKLKDLRLLQVAYKKTNNEFCDNFDTLMNFYFNDSLHIVKAEGETPDSLTDKQALEMGVISRDTSYVSVRETLFDEVYIKTRNNSFPIDENNMTKIPFTDIDYNIDAGVVNKGNVNVQVFEISATYKNVLFGLDAKNKKYDLEKLLKVGSMNEASLNGNWGE